MVRLEQEYTYTMPDMENGRRSCGEGSGSQQLKRLSACEQELCCIVGGEAEGDNFLPLTSITITQWSNNPAT